MEEERYLKKRPIEKWYLPLGPERGIQFTLWEKSLQLTRTEKNTETGRWETKQEIHLAPIILKELMWRIPIILEKMKER
jgi:hypothetical protein